MGCIDRPEDWTSRQRYNSNSSVKWCSCGRYQIGNDIDRSKFQLLGELNGEKIYNCVQKTCDGCKYLAIIDRSDSDAGLAGEFMAIADYQREFGELFEKVVDAKKSLDIAKP